MTRFLMPAKAKLLSDKKNSKGHKIDLEKSGASMGSWEMSARDALRVNFLTSEAR
jgi:hypothetical protein